MVEGGGKAPTWCIQHFSPPKKGFEVETISVQEENNTTMQWRKVTQIEESRSESKVWGEDKGSVQTQVLKCSLEISANGKYHQLQNPRNPFMKAKQCLASSDLEG